MSSRKRPNGAREIYDNFTNLARGTGPNFDDSGAQQTRALAFNMYHRKLSELAINRFKWYGLPKTVNQRFLEVTLFRQALSVFYYDRDPRVNAFMALAAGAMGKPNMQDDPTAFRVFRQPLSSFTLLASQCVPIWANTSRTPDHDMIVYYARRFAEWDTTIEINGMNARQTKIVSSDQNARLTMQNVNRQIVEGEPAIYASDKSQVADSISVLDLGIDLMGLEKLSIVRGRVWAECMQMLGINAATTEKKERVVADEVSQNDDQVMSNRAIALNERQAAAERINRKYGLDVRVEYRQDIDGVAASMNTGTYQPGSSDPNGPEK